MQLLGNEVFKSTPTTTGQINRIFKPHYSLALQFSHQGSFNEQVKCIANNDTDVAYPVLQKCWKWIQNWLNGAI